MCIILEGINQHDFCLLSAPGNIADHVIIERQSESTIMFGEGAREAYLGYVTLKFSPDIASTVPHHKHYALEVTENCSPTIDHCVIRSSSVGESLCLTCICES